MIGEDRKERRGLVLEIMWKVLNRKVRLRRIEERKGEAGRWVLLTKMEDIADKEDVLERGRKIKCGWGVRVDEDLTMKERRMRWKIVKAAKIEKVKRKEVKVLNRKLWVDRRKWHWDAGRRCWMKEKDGGEEGAEGGNHQASRGEWRRFNERGYQGREKSEGRSEK